MQDTRVVFRVWVQSSFWADTVIQPVYLPEEVPTRKPRRK